MRSESATHLARLLGARETRGGAAVEATVPLTGTVEVAHSRRPAGRVLKRLQCPLEIAVRCPLCPFDLFRYKTHLSLALVIRPFCFGRAAIGVVVPATDKHLLNRKTLFRLFPSEVETRELCKNIAAKFRESRVMLPTLKFHFYGTMASHSRNQAGMFLHYSVEREERERE